MDEEKDDIIFEEDSENKDISADLVKRLREKLKKCMAEKQEYLAGWQRAKADFINARKEEEENRREFIKFANKNFVFELLSLLDSFEEMLKHNQDEGIKNIYRQLLAILKNRGLEEIKSSGEKFNPEEHESIEEIKVDKQEDEGKIIEEIRKGYKMHGRVLRPAQVKVAVVYNANEAK
jgi:molecular chaperone GrpE